MQPTMLYGILGACHMALGMRLTKESLMGQISWGTPVDGDKEAIYQWRLGIER